MIEQPSEANNIEEPTNVAEKGERKAVDENGEFRLITKLSGGTLCLELRHFDMDAPCISCF